MEKIVEKVLNSDYKNRVQLIAEFQPPKEDQDFAKVVDSLLIYSSLPEVNVNVVKEKFKQDIENFRHCLIVLSDFDLEKPDERLKLKAKVIGELLDFIKSENLKIWLHVLLLEDIKQISMDSRFELFDILLKAKPLYDNGLYEIFRMTVIHKNILLDIFHKYVVAYVLAGSYMKGRAAETSDVDVYVVIDDTDVKVHTHSELKQKLYSLIIQKAMEVMALTQTKKILHPQVYTLTEFWLAMSEANPVIITFLRDGVALYDRGMFIAWKQLLIKGILKPSREAAEKYLNASEAMLAEADHKLKMLMLEEISLSMITAAQAVLMDYGFLPPDPKETPVMLRKAFVENKKLLEEDYVKKLEEIVKLRKDIEHRKKEEVKGSEIEEWMKIARDFINRMKRLKVQIDAEKEKEEISYYIQDFYALKTQVEDLYEQSLESLFESSFPTELKLLNDLLSDIQAYRDGKLDIIDTTKLKNSLINMNRFLRYLIENKKVNLIEKYSLEVVSNNKKYSVYLTPDYIFVVGDSIVKYNYLGEKLDEIPRTEFENVVLKEIKEKGRKQLDIKVLNVLSKIFGEFQIIF
jgi:uncharacterized protein (UPF0332 family)/predicted nucleotidyltransferase